MNEHDLLRSVVRRVDTDGVASEMVAAFRAGISGYQRLPEAVVKGQIADVARRNVELFFGSVLEGRTVTDEDLAPFRDSAKTRATEGMPLEDLLHAYRLGGRLGWQAMAEAANPDEHRALMRGAELLMEYVDRVSSAVAQAYLDERQHLVSEEERSLRDLLDALAGPAPLDFRRRELAERIGFSIAERYRPFAQTIPGAAARSHSRIAADLRSRGALALTEGNRVAGLMPPHLDLVVADDAGAVSAVGEPTARAELAAALDDVRLLADLGRTLGHSGRVSPEALLPELLLARSPRLAALLERRALRPLEEYAERRSSQLVDTLRVFLAADLDRRGAAEQLHVHPNTLDYRLKRIAELTGLDPAHVDDLIVLALAARARALTERTGPLPERVDPDLSQATITAV